MSFEEELRRSIKSKKIRKQLSDNVNVKLPRILAQSLQWISVGYSSALYFAGKKLGKEIISKELDGSNDMRKVLEEICGFFKGYGIGKLEIKDISNTCILTMKEGATSFGMKPVGKAICFFEAGMIAGIVEGKLNKGVLVNEILCCGRGDDVDEFLIKFT